MIRSVDKLRDYGHQCCARIDDAIHDYCDEIEAEFEENCMLLPLDADFERIRVGEVMNTPFGALPIGGIGCNRVWFMVDGRAEYAMCDSVSHVKQRTLEDVLADVVTLCANAWKDDKSPFAFYDVSDVMASGNIREYADEIRELLGGDAE